MAKIPWNKVFGAPAVPQLTPTHGLARTLRQRRDQRYILGLIAVGADDHCPGSHLGYCHLFDDPEVAGKYLATALKRRDFGEAIDLLRASGCSTDLTATTVAALCGPGDVWVVVAYHVRKDPQHSLISRKFLIPKAAGATVFYGGAGSLGKWDGDATLLRLAHDEAVQVAETLFLMAEVGQIG